MCQLIAGREDTGRWLNRTWQSQTERQQYSANVQPNAEFQSNISFGAQSQCSCSECLSIYAFESLPCQTFEDTVLQNWELVGTSDGIGCFPIYSCLATLTCIHRSSHRIRHDWTISRCCCLLHIYVISVHDVRERLLRVVDPMESTVVHIHYNHLVRKREGEREEGRGRGRGRGKRKREREREEGEKRKRERERERKEGVDNWYVVLHNRLIDIRFYFR